MTVEARQAIATLGLAIGLLLLAIGMACHATMMAQIGEGRGRRVAYYERNGLAGWLLISEHRRLYPGSRLRFSMARTLTGAILLLFGSGFVGWGGGAT